MNEPSVSRLRAFVLALFLKTVLLVAAEIVLLRVAAPYLFDLHNDAALVLAVLAALLAAVLAIWFAFDLMKAFRRYRRS